ncbi:MAG: DUF3782 domain-containing protein [Magnetococcales bacterium]|nr:DUF3782 domain-containing protein [Magnetococcales bacterium]
MSQTVTFDDIWRMFQEMVQEDRERRAELDRRFQETDRKFQETDRKFQETEQQMKETYQQIREVSAQMRETDRQMKETDRQMKETDRQMKETDRQMKETDRKIKEVSQQVGNLGSRWGEFVEGIVAPACETLFAERGVPVHRVSPRVKVRSLDGRQRMEIDLLVDNNNTDSIVLVEVKSRLTAEDVRDHLKRVREYKEFYEGEGGARVMGAVAGILIDKDVDRFAMNEGLFVIVQSGDSVKLANEETFVPRTW